MSAASVIPYCSSLRSRLLKCKGSNHGVLQLFKGTAVGAAVVIVSGLLSGCSQVQEIVLENGQWFDWHPVWSKATTDTVTFEFDVNSTGEGRYELRGEAELPEGSELAIAAVRYLKLDPDIVRDRSSDSLINEFIDDSELDNPTALNRVDFVSTSPGLEAESSAEAAPTFLALKPTYAILDYRPTKVRDGKWKTQLNLWDVAKDGRYQESWQLHQEELDLAWEPEPEVIFLATLIRDGAADRIQPIQNALAEQKQSLNATLLQTSLEGERFFQLAQMLPIELPTAKTQPPAQRIQDINGGWGRRYLLVEQDPLPGRLKFPEERNSNAPGSPKEFIQ